jgi:HAD superfamily hydrolase (TIGR01509 family)
MKDILKKFSTTGTTFQITQADREAFEELVETFGRTSTKIYDYKNYLQYFLKRFYVKPSDSELEMAYKMLLEARTKNMQPEEGAEETLKVLKDKGLQLSVLTNSYYERALYNLKKTGLLGYLDFVVTADILGSTKAEKEMYGTAMKLTRSKPNESAFVSAFEDDLSVAKKAGMKTILISQKKTKAKIDFQVRNIADLPRLQFLR